MVDGILSLPLDVGFGPMGYEWTWWKQRAAVCLCWWARPLVPLPSPWEAPWVAATSLLWALEGNLRAGPPQQTCSLKHSLHNPDASEILWFVVVQHYPGRGWQVQSPCWIQGCSRAFRSRHSWMVFTLSWPFTEFSVGPLHPFFSHPLLSPSYLIALLCFLASTYSHNYVLS